MIDINSQLTIKYYNGVTYSDYTLKSASFSRDTYQLEYLAATDTIYIGFQKPISAAFVNHNTSYATEGLLTGKYWNGISWADLAGFSDDTQGLKRSGFLRWNVAQSDQVSHVLDADSKYWYQFTGSVDRVALIIAGINLVFADDYDLSVEFPLVNDETFLGAQKNHVLIHVAVRNEILQRLKGKDYVKTDNTGNTQDLNVWDLHDILEVRQCSVFLALSKIYLNVSDSTDDSWSVKSAYYRDLFEKSIDLAGLSLDLNNDGIQQPVEKPVQSTTRYMTR